METSAYASHRDTHFLTKNASTAVGKALRRAAEGKASAQAEASEWKRKYELERARNLQLENKGLRYEQHKYISFLVTL